MHRSAIIFTIILMSMLPAWTAEEGGGRGELLGENPHYQALGETYTISCPTAWTRARGNFDVHMSLEPFLVSGNLSLTDFLGFGVSYGGEAVVGYGDPIMNPRPCFQAKVQLTNGSEIVPAIAVGYDDQGQGQFIENGMFEDGKFVITDDPGAVEYDRYLVKCKGIYGVLSQEYEFLGYIGIHAGANYAITETNDDKSPDGWVALEKSFGPDIDLVSAYDFGFNDDSDEAFGGDGPGFLDAGIRFKLAPEFKLEFYCKNLLNNQRTKLGEMGSWNRVLAFTYIITF